MHLSTWTADRVVEQYVYSRRRPSGSVPVPMMARESAAAYGSGDVGLAELRREMQVEFNAMCERASALVMADLKSGFDISDSVDAVFDDDEWNEHMRTLSRGYAKLPSDPLKDDKLEERFPWAVQLPVSPHTRRTAERCLRSLNAVLRAHQSLREANIEFPSSLPQEEQDNDHLWFMHDPVVPRAIQRGLLAHRRGLVALVSTYPVTAPPAPRQDCFAHVVRLLQLTTDSMSAYLGVLANYTEAGVTLVKPDGSDLTAGDADVVAPFREAMRRSGEAGVVEPA